MTSKTPVHRRPEGLIAQPAVEAALVLVRETGAPGFEPHLFLKRAELARLCVPSSFETRFRTLSWNRTV
jgi:hypothetical protein